MALSSNLNQVRPLETEKTRQNTVNAIPTWQSYHPDFTDFTKIRTGPLYLWSKVLLDRYLR
jgi:hypothetical protein